MNTRLKIPLKQPTAEEALKKEKIAVHWEKGPPTKKGCSSPAHTLVERLSRRGKGAVERNRQEESASGKEAERVQREKNKWAPALKGYEKRSSERVAHYSKGEATGQSRASKFGKKHAS